MPGRDMFGEEVWDIFSRPARADAYSLVPDQHGAVAGPTRIDSSSRQDAAAFHRIWATLQDWERYGAETVPEAPPVPEYLVRYGRGNENVDLLLDVDGGYLSIYPSDEPETAKWISIRPGLEHLREQFDAMFGAPRNRDLRPNL
ncbi:MAG: hypothetical protein ABIV13_07560 [Fimbriimonadales bacterium]